MKRINPADPFAMRRLAKSLGNIGVGLLAAGLMIGIQDSAAAYVIATICLAAFFALMLAYLLLSLIFWRCPHCGYGFGLRTSMRGFCICPHCGKRLRDE